MSECKKRSPLKHRRKRAFLVAYIELGNVTRAAAIAGISRESHYNWKANDPVYAGQFERARELAGDALEDECRRRACEGWDVPVFHKGKICGVIRKYSDAMAIALLRAAKPEKYGNKVTVDSQLDLRLAERLVAARKRVMQDLP